MGRINKTEQSLHNFLQQFSALCRQEGILVDCTSNGDLTIYKKSGKQWRKLGYLFYGFDDESELPNYEFSEDPQSQL